MSNLYQQLLAEVAKREADLKKAREAFELSQAAALKAAEALRNAADHLRPASSPATVTALKEPEHPAVVRQPSFIEVVQESIKDINSNITTALVFDVLTKQRVPLGDDPRTKISTALSRLEARGELIKSVSGSMGRPHTYAKSKLEEGKGSDLA